MTTTTVLIAEDDPVTLRALSAGLQAQGYHVITAVDALQAVRAALRSHPAAIVLDVQMPGGTGLEVLKRVKASSQTQLIPVIAISGSRDAALAGQVDALGAVAFLPKPVELPQLTDALRTALASRAPAARPVRAPHPPPGAAAGRPIGSGRPGGAGRTAAVTFRHDAHRRRPRANVRERRCAAHRAAPS